MTETDDTAGHPLHHIDGIPVPARVTDPGLRRLHAHREARLGERRWSDADLVGWLIDDLDRLSPPWGRVVRLLVGLAEATSGAAV